ncbi:MAG: hypothetical protein AAF602_28525, partial [Myxococcota bacterium]
MHLTELIVARRHATRRVSPDPLVAALAAMDARERVSGVLMLSGRLPCGPLGISVARLQEHVRRHPPPRVGPGLSILHATEGLKAIRGRRGMGAEKRLAKAEGLFQSGTPDDADFLLKLAQGSLRAPSFDRLVVQAIASVGDLEPAL